MESQAKLAREQECPTKLAREQKSQAKLGREQECYAKLARELDRQVKLARKLTCQTKLSNEWGISCTLRSCYFRLCLQLYRCVFYEGQMHFLIAFPKKKSGHFFERLKNV